MRLPKFHGCLLAFLAVTLPISAQTNAPAAANPAPAQRPPPPGIAMLRDVVFGKGGAQDLHATLAYPKNPTGPLPALIHIHGGGWAKGDYNHDDIIHWARAGYFTASIEYRLDGVAKWPAQIQDCKCAVRWLRANAAQYNVDLNRIGVIGESAGGHLVACLGTMADVKEYEGDGGYPGVSSAVQAVVDFYGPTDFITTNMDSSGAAPVVVGLFGVPRVQNPDLWKSGSPVAYVKAGDPPMLLVHGDSDTTVPLEQSIVFDAALTKAGVPHEFVIVKNAGHGLFPSPPGAKIDPDRPVVNQTVLDFLAKYLGPVVPVKP